MRMPGFRAQRADIDVCESASGHRGLVKAAYLSVWDDRRAIEVSLPGLPPTAALKRGDIDGMSDASRRRLLGIIHRIRRDAPLPIMLTVTFPEEVTLSGREAKLCWRAMAKRIEREYGDEWSALWRLEAHPEMSRRLGRMHPHIHALCWNVWFDLEWVSKTWAAVVWKVLKLDQGMTEVRVKLVAAGTSAERVRKWAGVSYVVKAYLAKDEEYPLGRQGRVWGWWKGQRLPLAAVRKVQMTTREVVLCGWRVRQWMAGRGIKSDYPLRSLFCDDPSALAEWLLAPESPEFHHWLSTQGHGQRVGKEET